MRTTLARKEIVMKRKSLTIRSIAFIITIISAIPNTRSDAAGATDNPEAIRPFTVNIPEEALADLRRRIKATRWPDKETVADQSQGVQLATMQKLARYWATDYDWRKCEAKLERPAAVRHQDRRRRHSFHSRSFET